MKVALCLLFFCAALRADGPGRIESLYLDRDVDLTGDPESSHWRRASPVFAENGPMGEPVPGHRMEVRSLWSDKHLYFLFICPYEELHLRPNPSTTEETNKLWEWDVAEVFVGADFQNIRQYREFQLSPQGEWVDLYIDRDKPKPEAGWTWNSGFRVKARIDASRKIWYGEMQIPITAIDARPPRAGNEMRINFYRIQGPPPNRKFVAWQPTHSRSYHVPEAFGRLILKR